MFYIDFFSVLPAISVHAKKNLSKWTKEIQNKNSDAIPYDVYKKFEIFLYKIKK